MAKGVMNAATRDTAGVQLCEIFELSDKIRELTNQHVSADAIRKEAIKNGMKTMREDGINKILSNITTAEEVLRVTQMD